MKRLITLLILIAAFWTVEAQVQKLPGGDYTGLSSDTKPTTDVAIGAIFYERDMKQRYVWDGSEWKHLVTIIRSDTLEDLWQGRFYRAVDVIDLSNAQVYKYSITTADNLNDVHLRLTHEAEAEIDVKIYENPSSLSGGSEITVYNRNRQSTNSTTATVKEGVTASGGALIDWEHHGSGKQAGGGDEDALEWILKHNEDYVIQVTNATTSDNQFSIRIQFYEDDQ